MKSVDIKGSLAACLLLAGGCVNYGDVGAFSHRFPDNKEEPLNATLVTSVAAPQNPTGKPLAVATTHGEKRNLVAFGTDGQALWTTPLNAMTRPEILGDVVMTSTREDVIAIDAGSGKVLWKEELDGLAYVGAARQGNLLAFVTSVGASGGAKRVGQIRAVDARRGSSRWDWDIQGVLGKPIVTNKHVMVPWDRQNIAILDSATGLESARLRSTDDVISWVRGSDAGVFYGDRGMYRLDAKSHSGTKAESTYHIPPVPDAPREPMIEEDGFFPTPGTRSARGRIRLFYNPAPGDAVVPADDRVYFVYYRYLFAYNDNNELQWARMLSQDVINAQVLSGGIFTVGEQGEMNFIDSSGALRFRQKSDMELAAVGLDMAAFTPGEAIEAAPAIRESLHRIAGDPDNRLVPARAYAVQQLARLPEAEVSRDLLDLYAQRATPSLLKEAISAALQERGALGQEHLIEALDTRYDFLAGTKPPPLGLIVPALLNAKNKEAVTPLIGHMLDHETPFDVLPAVVRAVVELGDDSVVSSLNNFLILYHADSTFKEKPDALAAAAEGVFKRGGDPGRGLLQELIADGSTTPPVSAAISGLFQREVKEAEAKALAEANAAERAAQEAARREAAARPTRLSQAQINAVFTPKADAIRACSTEELSRNPKLAQIRIVFILNNSGVAEDFSYAPNTPEFVACLKPNVEKLVFPKFQQRRQRAALTISLGGNDNAAPAVETPGLPNVWWARNESRKKQMNSAMGRPWWETRQASEGAQPQPKPPTGDKPPAGEPGKGPWWMQRKDGEADPEQPSTEPSEPAKPEEDPWWTPTE